MVSKPVTSRERTLTAIAHKNPDKIPLTFYVEQPLYDRMLKEFGPRETWPCPPDDIIRILWPIDYSDITEAGCKDMFGCDWIRHEQGGFMMANPPMKEPEANLIPRIDILPQSEIDRILQTRKKHPDKFIFYQFTSSFGERLWSLRGLEQTFMDYLLYPDFVSEALDILLEMHMKALEKLLKLPVDCVTFGDDMGSQRGLLISRKLFLKFFKPRYAMLYERVRAAGMVVGMHSCGDNTELMSDFVDIGLQIFHPLQPEAMDIAHIKKEFGKDLTFRGGLSTQRAIPFGTPQEARQEIRDSVRVLSQGGGYLMETAKPLRPETPIENVIAVMEEMTKLVNYDFSE